MALATICGALGAHALPGRLTAGELEIYDTAVRFQFFQALGLLVLGAVARGGYSDCLHAAALLLVGGIVAFCGSLYLLAFHITLGVPLVVGLTTPLGGILLIGGWVMFAVRLVAFAARDVIRPAGLPIEAVLPELTAALATATRVVLQAPPGAGKSTVVPLALLDCDWLRGAAHHHARAAPARGPRGRRAHGAHVARGGGTHRRSSHAHGHAGLARDAH